MTSPIAVPGDEQVGPADLGADARARLGRRSLAKVTLPAGRDPIGILERQHESRLTDLVPVRIGRMAQSAFAYYRGTAAVMAADLAAEPNTGIDVVSCGDAHISNFGFFASPERSLLFDLIDFDEGSVAPWEWDLKRLAASVHVGGRDIGMTEDACRQASKQAVEAYCSTLRRLLELTSIERYYTKVDSSLVASLLNNKSTDKAVRKAKTRTSARVLDKMTIRSEDGALRIVDQPPITTHVTHADRDGLRELFLQYISTLPEDVAYLLSRYRLADFVLRVVGVGSVGTRCYVIALVDPDGDVLFLQAKEAQASVLSSHGGRPTTIPGAPEGIDHTEGRRVVACQRVLQSHSDPFLGHIVGWDGSTSERTRVDYYWRQFRDMKGSIDPSLLEGPEFAMYGALCGGVLARAHSQSPNAAAISAYIGKNDRVAQAISEWSALYANVCEADYRALLAAIDSGRLPAQFGV